MKTKQTAIPIRTASEEMESPYSIEQQIRARAYQLYEERGKSEGHELDDWLQAEIEVSGKQKVA